MKDFKNQLSQKFLNQLTQKFSNQYEELMDSLRDINSENALGMPITDIKAIKAILNYTSIIDEKTKADLMNKYSSCLLSVNQHDSFSERKVLETADALLEHNKLFFENGVLNCYKTLKKEFGNSYSDNALRNAINANCGARLKISSEKFLETVKDWIANIENMNKETEKETDATKA